MHQEVMDWLALIKSTSPETFSHRRVLECGSLNINGTPRPLFEDCDYVGIDWREGPDVDVVSLTHHFIDNDKFDVVISTEMLEHDPYWLVSISNMVSLLRPRGDLIMTFGGVNRPRHELNTSPQDGYYKGLPSTVVYMQLAHAFEVVHIHDDCNDVYIWCEDKR